MIGGFQEQANVSNDHKDLITANLAQINNLLHVNCASYQVNKVHTQVVAGINYFFHLTGDNNEHYSVSIHVPLPNTNAPT